MSNYEKIPDNLHCHGNWRDNWFDHSCKKGCHNENDNCNIYSILNICDILQCCSKCNDCHPHSICVICPTDANSPADQMEICKCKDIDCDCTSQIRNVLQKISIAAKAMGHPVSLQINTTNGGTTTSSLSNPSQVGNGIITLNNGYIVSLSSIAWIRVLGNTTFESLGLITPLLLPDPIQTSCEHICEKEIRDSLLIGTIYNIMAGGTTTGNSRLNIKAVGILFAGVSDNSTDTAIITCKIEIIDPPLA